jgi:hypothetical protein
MAGPGSDGPGRSALSCAGPRGGRRPGRRGGPRRHRNWSSRRYGGACAGGPGHLDLGGLGEVVRRVAACRSIRAPRRSGPGRACGIRSPGHHHRRRDHGPALHRNLTPHQPRAADNPCTRQPPDSGYLTRTRHHQPTSNSIQPIRQAITQRDPFAIRQTSQIRLPNRCSRAQDMTAGTKCPELPARCATSSADDQGV